MKKLIMIVAVVAGVISAQAASVNWKVTGTSAETGYSVYLLAAAPETFASVADLAAAAVGTGSIAKNGRTYDTGVVSSAADSITATSMANAYFVIVKSADASEYTYLKQDMSASVYDPANQESAKATFAASSSAILAGTTAQFQSVPEPTLGLLMLLGVAGLALRRRRA